MSNPHRYEAGFTIEQHRDELIERLGKAIKRINELESKPVAGAGASEVCSFCDKPIERGTGVDSCRWYHIKAADAAKCKYPPIFPVPKVASSPMEGASQIDSNFVGMVENEVGFTSFGWDGVDPIKICNAVLKLSREWPVTHPSSSEGATPKASFPVDVKFRALCADGSTVAASLLNWIKHTVPEWTPEVQQCMEASEEWIKRVEATFVEFRKESR